MVASALKRLRKARGTKAFQEIPLLGRTIDLVYLRGSSLTSVEFKLTDWRRAMMQARDHQLAADFSYICMPTRRLTEPMRLALRESGVGLFFFSHTRSWPFEKVVPARRSRDKWKAARADLVEYMRSLAAEKT